MNKYKRKCKSIEIDVYDILKSFEVINPATQHAIKKLLAGGQRSYKNVVQDYHEAIQSIYRAIELESENIGYRTCKYGITEYATNNYSKLYGKWKW